MSSSGGIMYKHLWYLQSRPLCVSKSDGHGVPNANLFNFTFLLVDFGKVLCSSANELHTSLFLGTVELKIALWARKVSRAFEKRAPGLTKNIFGPLGPSFMLILTRGNP